MPAKLQTMDSAPRTGAGQTSEYKIKMFKAERICRRVTGCSFNRFLPLKMIVSNLVTVQLQWVWPGLVVTVFSLKGFERFLPGFDPYIGRQSIVKYAPLRK